MNNDQHTKKKSQWPGIARVILFTAIAIALAVFTFNQVSAFVATWDITSLPGLAVVEPTPTPPPGEAVETSGEVPAVKEEPALPQGASPQPWDGASRVTVLLMGLDYNDWREGEGPPRTDTMMLLTLDPLTMSAGILSIPRDLWVSIPGFDYGKINTAYQLGEAYNLPGGGPGLAIATVEHLLGVPIQYYAQVDFAAFVKFIDEIGGVMLDVPYEITIDLYNEKRDIKRHIEPGRYTFPGEWALAYARARNTAGGDFDRAQRQQQIVLAIRDRILSRDLIPILVSKGPVLYQELSSGINTNLNLDEVFELAWLAQQVPEENIVQGVIGSEHVSFGKSPDGLDVLKPLPDKIRELRDQVFAPPGSISPLLEGNPDPQELMVAENARLALLNGTFTPGLAGRTADYLKSLGANVQRIADAAEKPYEYTVIFDHTGNPYTVKYLVDLLNISKFRVYSRFDLEKGVDVTVILGNDWYYNNPMP